MEVEPNFDPISLEPVQAVRYRIAGNQPRITDAVRVGEAMRTAVLSVAGSMFGFDGIPTAFSGKDRDGIRRDDDHMHAFYLCEPDLSSGTVTHLCVHVPAGLQPDHLAVLAGVTRFWVRGPEGFWLEPDEADPFAVSPAFGEACEWFSLTPFVPGRHPHVKRSEKHSRSDYASGLARELGKQVRAELSARALPEPVEVEIGWRGGLVTDAGAIPWSDFTRWRSADAAQPAVRYGHGIRLRFAAPVRGPIALGYASHFGLGMFYPRH